ncbi:hypothetical protein KSP40_PGU006420 [Platanthera guangdongensis]|uniref:Uncharacterized protein n=1 Tax=Platanthera guangdongensis TaxID=2320717 RepID=A0ABR2LKT8_9ASPA
MMVELCVRLPCAELSNGFRRKVPINFLRDLAATRGSTFVGIPIYVEDLENILDENLVLSFNAEILDGSIEEMAEQLLLMHEDYLNNNCDFIEKLRSTVPEEKL